jgi:hypothetical protein
MTKERRAYLREYNRDYRKEGFGKVADKKYYMNHRESILEKQRKRDKARASFRKKLRNSCEN